MANQTTIVYPVGFNLIELSLATPSVVGNFLDLRPYLIEVNFFEDIFSPSLTGQIVISEAVGFESNYRLNGTEFVTIQFSKFKGDRAVIKKTFRVYKISKRKMDSSYGYESFVLNLCSEELMVAEQYRISKSYKGKDIKFMISNILEEYLKVNKLVNIEETKGVYDFILPNRKIFETISWLSNYAQPKNNTGADMLFFENSQGYQFHSLQSLYNQPPFTKYFYNPKNVSNNMESKVKNVMKYEVINFFDVLGGISDGTFTNRLITIDPLTKGIRTTDFDYNKYLSQFSTKILNSNAVIPYYKDRHEKGIHEAPDQTKIGLQSGVLRLATSNFQQKKKVLIPDAVANDIMMEIFVPNRVAQLALSNYIKLRIQIPGNNELVAGMTINLSIPTTAPKSDKNLKQQTEDPLLSGKYLITAVRHIIKVNSPAQFITVLEISKDSVSGPLPTAPETAEWRDFINGVER